MLQYDPYPLSNRCELWWFFLFHYKLKTLHIACNGMKQVESNSDKFKIFISDRTRNKTKSRLNSFKTLSVCNNFAFEFRAYNYTKRE